MLAVGLLGNVPASAQAPAVSKDATGKEAAAKTEPAKAAPDKTATPEKAVPAPLSRRAAAPAGDTGPAPGMKDPVLEQLEKKEKEEAEKREKARKKIPRQKHIDKPGAKRDPVRNLLVGRQMEVPAVTPNERRSYQRMKIGHEAVDPKLIDKVIKNKIYRMSQRSEVANLGSIRKEMIDEIAQARDAENKPIQQFIEEVKKAVIKYAPDLLSTQFSIAARINVLLLLGQLYDGKYDVDGAAAAIIRVLRDPRQEEGVWYTALNALITLKTQAQSSLKIQDERAAVEAIYKIIARKDVELQDVLLEKIEQALGVLGRPFIGDIPDKAQVASHLARICLDRNLDLRRRKEAAAALGKMKVNDIFGWRSLPATVAVGMVALDACRAFQDEKKKQKYFYNNRKVFEKWMADIRSGWKVAYAAAWASDEEPHKQQAQELMEILNEMAAGGEGPPQCAPLEKLLNDHLPPKDKRFTFQAEELPFPSGLNGKQGQAENGQ